MARCWIIKNLGNFNMEKMTLNSTLNTPTTLNFDFQLLQKPLLVLRTMNHRLRQDMMHLIHREQKLTVTDIYIKLRLEQSVASQHLSLLRKSGIVTTIREGKFVYYSIDYTKIEELTSLFQKFK